MIELNVDQSALAEAAAALKSEADGKGLRRDLLRELKATTTPLVSDLKSAAQSIPSSGLAQNQGQPLRQAIAASIVPQVRLSGKNTGVAVRAKSTPHVRGFRWAARRMNRDSFRHRVYGRDVWVEQRGKPGWFDDTTKARRDDLKRAVLDAVEDMAKRIANRAKG